jgi:hypothetical protein
VASYFSFRLRCAASSIAYVTHLSPDEERCKDLHPPCHPSSPNSASPPSAKTTPIQTRTTQATLPSPQPQPQHQHLPPSAPFPRAHPTTTSPKRAKSPTATPSQANLYLTPSRPKPPAQHHAYLRARYARTLNSVNTSPRNHHAQMLNSVRI